MAKECSVCKNINHGEANHCSRCGSELPDKELTSEEALLIEVATLKKQNKALAEALANAEVGIFPDIEKKVEEIKQLYEENTALSKDKTQLLSSVQLLESKLAKMKEEITKKIASKQQVENELAQLMDASKIEVKQLNAMNMQLENDLSKAQKEIAKHETTIAEYEKMVNISNTKKHKRIVLILSCLIGFLLLLMIIFHLIYNNNLQQSTEKLETFLKKSGIEHFWQIDRIVTVEVKNISIVGEDGGTYTYSGELKDGQPHGQGVADYKNGNNYEGAFENGLYHGKGTMMFKAESATYTGSYLQGKREGYGEIYEKGGTYKGEWKDDKRHGRGTVYDAQGNKRFEGLWENDKMNNQEIKYPRSNTFTR